MEMRQLIEKVESADIAKQANALERISQLASFGCVDVSEANLVAPILLRLLNCGTDPELRIAVFDALAEITGLHPALDAPWDNLANSLSTLSDEELEYAMVILGNTLNPKYLPELTLYQSHADPQTAEAAAVAVRLIADSSA